ncbi:MAG: type-F conjugative transfer system pilin assembly protein TraF [Waddliaceae bacterium]|nr:type-F conjugative transfer system pilin assembly protein TraF [Waddliaceae bacterium]
MSNKFLNILLTVIIFIYTSELQASWHDQKARGWSWYEKIEEGEEEEENQEEKIQSPSQILKAEQALLEEKMAAALLVPSQENVSSYMEAQQKWINQSALFANSWMKALLESPNLDPRVIHPVSQYGSQIRKEEKRKDRKKLLENLSKTHGLFFFFEGENPYSQAMGKVVKVFALRYGWEVFSVTVDGHGVQDYPKPERDNGMAESLGISLYPALFAVNPINKEMTPLAFGLTALDVLESNIEMQFGSDLEHDYVVN